MPLKIIIPLCLTLISGSVRADENLRWEVMTRSETGVARFQAQQPTYDGRGVVIAVLDTGVDMGAAGLTGLPQGGVKVVDCRDFTGEGDIHWEPARLVPGKGKDEKLMDAKGRSLTQFRDKVKDALNQNFQIAFIEEAAFSDTAVKDLNGDGDTKDAFGVLVHLLKDEKTGDAYYAALVDLNGDGNLSDGAVITDYRRRHETCHLQGKAGGRRNLTLACNFFPAENRLSLHFDAQGHGTHVAGIAAGFQIHGQKGYHGMAPGAQVLSLKIGFNGYAGGATVTESVKQALDFGAAYAKDHDVPVVFNMSYGIMAEQDDQSAIDQYINKLLWDNPRIIFVTSAGNSGPGLSTIGTPGTAHRAITAGASLSPEAAPAQYGHALTQEIPFGFSSRGGDFFKPDIIAPGSACSTVPMWKDRDHGHGTSMASPATAGSVAVLVSALLQQSPPCPIDNRLIHRAIKNTGRHINGLTHLDEGGGAVDIPTAFAYVKHLVARGEHESLREYRISNATPAGVDTVYCRTSPGLPAAAHPMNLSILPGFAAAMTQEAKARFYRALRLTPGADWIGLTKSLIYFKGGISPTVGISVNLAGKKPGIYTGLVTAQRAQLDTLCGKPLQEFAIPVCAIVPHRVTRANRGRIRTEGQVPPNLWKRVFLEVPAGTVALAMSLRLTDTPSRTALSAAVFDPEGFRRGGIGAVSAEGERQRKSTLSTGAPLKPGVWEVVISSRPGSTDTACYEFTAMPCGGAFGTAVAHAGEGPVPSRLHRIPLSSTQAAPLSVSVSGRVEGFSRERIMTVSGKDTFTRTVHVDNTLSDIAWAIAFDPATYALFTDCVLRIEDARTGKTLRNSALDGKTGSVTFGIASSQSKPKAIRLVLKPAFTLAKDTGTWRFRLSESRRLRHSPGPLTIIAPHQNRLTLQPGHTAEIDFQLPGSLPEAPAGYLRQAILTAQAQGWSIRKIIVFR